MDSPSHTIPSARFSLEGIDIEVEPCLVDLGTWRARRVYPFGQRGDWFKGRYAWQAMEAVVEAAGKTVTAG